MKRICLFAGYDKNNIIHDYVVYYLKELSSVSDVYYMADNHLNKKEKDKILEYTKGVYGYHHGKYDFGSWQQLIDIVGFDNILEYDELILTNDSIFGPMYPIKKLFEEIEKDKTWDICGLNHNILTDYGKIDAYLNSYFLILKKNAFNSNIFKNIISSLKDLKNNKIDYSKKYEFPFAKYFYDSGYKVKSYMGEMGCYNEWYKPSKINKNRLFPFIKKKIFIHSSFNCSDKNMQKLYKQSKAYYYKKYVENNSFTYDVNLIKNFLKKNNISEFKLWLYDFFQINTLKDIRRWIIQIKLNKKYKIVRLLGIYFINEVRYTEVSPITIIDSNH